MSFKILSRISFFPPLLSLSSSELLIIDKDDRTYTGHVELPSQEPADLAAAELAVLDPVERLHPAESVSGGGPPEPVRIRD